jgi:two-component system, chemotaxis family, chemotaxis protein CheY
MVRKKTNYTKSVEASAFVVSKMYFSQHMNRGKCFALFAKHIDGGKMARIMVVDDTYFMRALIKAILSQAGHVVVAEARDGGEALRNYMLYKPDLVTMDITMSGMNGLDAVKAIISNDKDAKIIMISAMSQKSMVIGAIRNGAKHFIIKPVTVEKVIGVINDVLGIKAEIRTDREDFKGIKQSIEEMEKAIVEIDKVANK